MMTDLECQQEEHEALCRARDIEQGCWEGDDQYGLTRAEDTEE
jgi:hypothetical protein